MFEGLADLRRVELPWSVRTIHERAFCDCAKLERVTIADGPARVRDYDYYDNLNHEVGYEAFANCVNLVHVDIPDGVTRIEWQAFYNCAKLTDVTLPDSVMYIEDEAFWGCSGLTSLNFPDAVRNYEGEYYGGVRQIGYRAFEYCTGLKRLELPLCIESIYDRAFANCYSLKDVTLTRCEGGCYDDIFWCDDYERPRQWETVVVRDGFWSRNSGYVCDGFGHCPNLRTVVLPPSVIGFRDTAFQGCAKLESVTISEGVRPNNYDWNEWDGRVGQCAFEGCARLRHVDIPDGVWCIDHEAFSDCGNLTDVTLPDSVEVIGEEAFDRCSSLKTVNFPDAVWDPESNEYYGGVRSILEGAFSGCIALTAARLPDCLYDIERDAFSGCWGLRDVVLPKAVFESRDGWSGRQGLPCVFGESSDYYWDRWGEQHEVHRAWETVVVGEGVTEIGDELFADLASLRSVELPRSVRTIGEGAFRNCAKLARVTLPKELTRVGDEAFRGCGSLKGLAFPEGLAFLGNGAFSDCRGLVNLTVPNCVTNIGEAAFAGCGGLLNVVFDGDAPVVGTNAFDGVAADCMALVNRNSSGWGVEIPGTWQGLGIAYRTGSAGAAGGLDIVVTQAVGGWRIVSSDGSPLTQERLSTVRFKSALADNTVVDTTKGYAVSLAEDGRTATCSLKRPEFAAAAWGFEVERDEADPTGILVKVPAEMRATTPAVGPGESVGALPVQTVPGLWYRASWSPDLQHWTQGEKVQATGDVLYLGVVKQSGSRGFYKFSVSEK